LFAALTVLVRRWPYSARVSTPKACASPLYAVLTARCPCWQRAGRGNRASIAKACGSLFFAALTGSVGRGRVAEADRKHKAYCKGMRRSFVRTTDSQMFLFCRGRVAKAERPLQRHAALAPAPPPRTRHHCQVHLGPGKSFGVRVGFWGQGLGCYKLRFWG
jgi:hypothetical protein